MVYLIALIAALLLPTIARAQTFPGLCVNGLIASDATSISTCTNTPSLTGTLTLTAPSGVNQALIVHQFYPTSGAPGGPINYLGNPFIILTDGLNLGSGQSTNLYVQYNFGGNASILGQRNAINGTTLVTGVTGNSGAVGVVGGAVSNFNMGGTAPVSSNGAGTLFGANFLAQAQTNATYLAAVIGLEADVEAEATNLAVDKRIGIGIAGFGQIAGALQGTTTDAAIAIYATNPDPGFKNIILLTGIGGGRPIGTNGCIICTDGTAWSIAKGIDFGTGLTFSGNAFKSPGFTVDGSGNITGRMISSSGAGGGIETVNRVSGTAPSWLIFSASTDLSFFDFNTSITPIVVTSGAIGAGFETISYTTPSTSTTTGALVVSGGVGVGGKVSAASYATGTTAGVDCTGITAGTVTVAKGIVTHC